MKILYKERFLGVLEDKTDENEGTKKKAIHISKYEEFHTSISNFLVLQQLQKQ
jgi:hypothetical protein